MATASPESDDDPSVEPVEIVDEHGAVEQIITRAEMRRSRLRHRTVFIAVIDDARRLLVHRRSPHKDVWPDRWDLAAGGVVGVGEGWLEAARRELREELGLTGDLRRLEAGTYDDDDVAELAEVYLIRSNGPVHFDDGEVVEARWLDRMGLRELLASNPHCPDSVALVLPLVESMLATG